MIKVKEVMKNMIVEVTKEVMKMMWMKVRQSCVHVQCVYSGVIFYPRHSGLVNSL